MTVALCGSWEHHGPCPLAPHHSATRRSTSGLVVRVLFATEPEHEAEARAIIADALAAGRLSVPSVGTDSWRLKEQGRSELADGERELAARLVASN